MADSSFIDLASFAAPPSAQPHARPKVIKAPQVATSSRCSVEICEEGDDRPTLIVRKNGGVVVGFDIVCSCGRTSTVDLEYREE
jgi:hypothetical protein